MQDTKEKPYPNKEEIYSPSIHIENNETDPCQNYCYHGSCYLNFGSPTCNCTFSYSGMRCEKDVCFNLCLNDGLCQISDDGIANCICSKGFFGPRCQSLKEDNEIKYYEIKYFVVFCCMIGINVGLFIGLLVLISFYCKRLRQQKQPQIIKKSPVKAPRIFSPR